jgi:hypothetical protein
LPDEFDVESTAPFDPGYMNALFQLGHDSARNGEPWRHIAE